MFYPLNQLCEVRVTIAVTRLSHTLLSLITCGVITLKPSATNPSTPLLKETVALLRSTLLLPTNQTKHKITLNWYLQFRVVLFCVFTTLVVKGVTTLHTNLLYSRNCRRWLIHLGNIWFNSALWLVSTPRDSLY